MKKILFITNGHGEDACAAEIIRHLINLSPEIAVTVLPLVGRGSAFNNLPVKLIGDPRPFPSGGFSLRNFTFLVRDLCAGYLPNLLHKVNALRKLTHQFTVVVGVGDLVPLIFSRWVKAPFVLVGVNKSAYYHSFGFDYTSLDKYLLKKYARKVFVRDQVTCDKLAQNGLVSEFLGNPLMDCIDFSQKINLAPDKTYVTLLPGSHADALKNFADLTQVAQLTEKLNPGCSLEFLIPVTPKTYPALSSLLAKSPKNNFHLLPNHFGSALLAATLVVGLAGSANEQAAGLGKPVVAFPGRGSQYNQKFAAAQKQLLGEALWLTSKENAPHAIVSLLNDPERREKMGSIGRQRMVRDQASQKIAKALLMLVHHPYPANLPTTLLGKQGR